MEKLKTLLENHDWHYERSDDMRAWRRGVDSNKRILAAMKELGVDNIEVIELYNQHKPF